MVWEYKIITAKVLKGKATLSFEVARATELLNEEGRAEWELAGVCIVGTEPMFTFKRPQPPDGIERATWR